MVNLTSSRNDWEQMKECYVQSFRRYPLYKYMVPDETKRDEFLRAYLDANYEVTVGSGQGILVKLTVDFANIEGHAKNTIAGGVLCVPPSSDGCGWAIGDDRPYWKAYDKYKLVKISKEGFDRLKRYEAWENKQIADKFTTARIPAWNGLFCAISPKFSTRGIGTALYKEAIKLIAMQSMQKRIVCCKREHPRVSLRNLNQTQKEKEKREYLATEQNEEDDLCSDRIPTTMPCHHIHKITTKCKKVKFTCATRQTDKHRKSENSTFSKDAQLPKVLHHQKALVVAISHSERAAHYYETNGFHPTVEKPYVDNVSNITPFNVHVLVLDPFKTGASNCRSLFESNVNFQKDINCKKL